MNEEEIRGAAIGALEERGYEVQAVGSGSGVPKSSRLAIRKPGSPALNCVVKVTTSGRISFVGKEGKPWGALTDADYVLYAHAREDGSIRVQLFQQKVIENAFNTLHAALEAKGRGHIPHWLAPFHEKGLRFTGSGFGDKADWTVDLNERSVPAVSKETLAASFSLADAISQSKELIARAAGKSPAEIDLTISIRS